LNNSLTIVGSGGGGPYVLTDQSFAHIGRLFLESGAKIVESDGNLAPGTSLPVQIQSSSTIFDGSAETDSQFFFDIRGLNDVVVTGGALSDTFTVPLARAYVLSGGGGNDVFSLTGTEGTFSGDAGADTFNLNNRNNFGGLTLTYAGVGDSTSVNYDTVENFLFSSGSLTTIKFDLPGTVSAIDTSVTTGSLSTATFDSDLAADLGSAQLAANDAVLFTPNAGGLSGQEFLIVDVNGQAGYQPSEDLVIHLVNPQGTLTTANFI
jgi:hypothetical protein